ncbi:MAG: hypothetical protein ACI89E_002247, partial [Planctomycetota bacterium]
VFMPAAALCAGNILPVGLELRCRIEDRLNFLGGRTCDCHNFIRFGLVEEFGSGNLRDDLFRGQLLHRQGEIPGGQRLGVFRRCGEDFVGRRILGMDQGKPPRHKQRGEGNEEKGERLHRAIRVVGGGRVGPPPIQQL